LWWRYSPSPGTILGKTRNPTSFRSLDACEQLHRLLGAMDRLEAAISAREQERALPVFDMSALSLSGVTPPAFHPIALALIAITAALLWRRAAASRTSA